MRTLPSKQLLLRLLPAGVIFLCSTVLGAEFYIVVDLGTNGGTYSDGRALNEAGQCVGFSGGAPVDRAYRTSGIRPIEGATDDLGTLGGSFAQAYGINQLGQAVGLAGFDVNRSAYRAFRTAPNQPINPATDDLGLLAGNQKNLSFAYDVNDSGQVVGVSDTGGAAGFPAHAFRTGPNQPINPATDDLGTLGGDYSEARAINHAGQVAGFATLAGDAVRHAVRIAPGAAINPATDDLGTLGGSNSVGRDINEAGVVVGEAQLPGGQWRAFRTSPNAAIDSATDNLGTLGGDSSRATAVNNHNDVVGFSTTSNGVRHAFLYTDASGIHDLNDLSDPTTAVGWELVEARDIDDAGRIAGKGTFNGRSHAFVLIPSSACDVDRDGDFDTADLARLTDCLAGPSAALAVGCDTSDIDNDGDADLGDFAALQACVVAAAPTLPCDIDGDGVVDLLDLAGLIDCLAGPASTTPDSCASSNIFDDSVVDLHDFAVWQVCFSSHQGEVRQHPLKAVKAPVIADQSTPTSLNAVRLLTDDFSASGP